MKNIRFVYVFFITLGIGFIASEALYRLYPVATSRTEMRLHGLNNIQNKKLDYAVFGSSATHDSLGHEDLLTDNFYNGSSVVNITVAGEYFLLKELISNGNTVKKVYVSFLPKMLTVNFLRIDKQGHPSYRYFRDVFHAKYKDEIIEAYPGYEHDYSYFRIRKFYFLALIDRLRGSKRYINKNTTRYKSIDAARRSIKKRISGIKDVKEVSNDVGKAIEELRRSLRQGADAISEDNMYFMNKLYQYSREKGFELFFVLEPMPLSIYREFSESGIYRELEALPAILNGSNFLDANKYYRFDDRYFKDPFHLKRRYGVLYEKIMYEALLAE